MNKSLVEILAESNEIEKQIIENEGMLTPEIETSLECNAKNIANKIDGYEFVSKNLAKKAEFFELLAKKYSTIASSLYKYESTMKERVKNLMMVNGMNEIKGSMIKYKLVKAQDRLVITDEKILPDIFTIVVTEPDKAALKEALKEGMKVDGAHLEPSFALKSFVNRDGDKE